MEIRCPYCEKTVQVPGGGQFTCPSCRAVFAVDLPAAPPPLPQGAGAGPPPLPPETKGPTAPATGPVCARHPQTAAGEVCSRCGNFMCGACVARIPDGSRLCPDCMAVLRPGYLAGGVIPWEHERAQKGLLGSYWQTMTFCFKEPERFWQTLNPDGEMGPATGYSVLAHSLFQIPMLLVMAAFFFFFFALIVASMPGAKPAQLTAMGGIFAGILAVSAVLVPLTAALGLYVTAAIYHLVAAIVGCSRGFSTTLRIIGYSQGTMIGPTAAAVVLGLVLKFIPCLGDMVSTLIQLGLFGWGLVIQYHGFRIQHNLTQGRALVCVLWWVACFCCLFGGFIFLMISMVAAGGASGGRGF